MAGLEMAQQHLLVGFGDRIGPGRLGNPGCGELLQQNGGGLVQLGSQFGDGGTCHRFFSPLGPPLVNSWIALRHR